MPRTLYDELRDEHIEDDGSWILNTDRHLVHEVNSSQAFERLRKPDGKRAIWPSREHSSFS